MHYAEFPPAPDLQDLIECVWVLEGDAPPSAAPPERVMPDGCAELIVHLGVPFERLGPEGRGEPQPAAFLVGQLTRLFVIRPRGAFHTLGVRFRPHGAYPFFGVPLSAATDAQIPLDALWGSAAARLVGSLAAAPGARARVGLLERALRARRSGGRPPHRAVVESVGALLRSRGRVSIESLGRRSGVGRRHLERRFREEVGIAPKTLARVVRLQGVLRAAAEPDAEPWIGVALDSGFSDQTHLIRDVVRLAGSTPARLQDEMTPLARLFTASARLERLLGRD